MSKKLIAILLTLSLFLASFGGIGVFAEENDIPNNETATVDNPYNKIHFYFNNEDHTIIDSPASPNVPIVCKTIVLVLPLLVAPTVILCKLPVMV